tara:strand:- start:1275 stop:1460 length:186 start_codon:yes stop_codon:yes gene_type:complete
MDNKEFVEVVKKHLKKKWPAFKAELVEDWGDEFNEEDGLNSFKEIMIANLSDLVVEVWAEL